jgi:translation initiation factor eIF-2B subunit epsilon
MEKKEIIQAVVMADNFSDCFKPFTSFNSPALLPVVNVPLISYVLESLNRNGVEEVWVVCSTFVEKVREFVK